MPPPPSSTGSEDQQLLRVGQNKLVWHLETFTRFFFLLVQIQGLMSGKCVPFILGPKVKGTGERIHFYMLKSSSPLPFKSFKLPLDSFDPSSTVLGSCE